MTRFGLVWPVWRFSTETLVDGAFSSPSVLDVPARLRLGDGDVHDDVGGFGCRAEMRISDGRVPPAVAHSITSS